MCVSAYLERVSGERFELAAEGIWPIGRGRHNSIDLQSDLVSRNHAIIQAVEPGVYFLSDRGSQNGTFANRRPVTAPILLQESDQIAIGDYEFNFHQTREACCSEKGTNAAPEFMQTSVRLAMKTITVLVIDVRGFTLLAAEIGPALLAQVMRCYFRDAGQVLQDQGAWTQKYIGDAVMAIWVHEPDQKSEPVQAAVCSLIRIEEIAAALQRRFGLNQPVRIAAGLNTGFASIGNIGSSMHADYTALGETVIMAFRLEKVTREIACNLAVGVAAGAELERIAGRKFFNSLDVTLKGFPGLCQICATSVDTLAMELGPAINA